MTITAKERGHHSTPCKFQFTSNLVSGKTWTNEIRFQPPKTIASFSISFPLLLLLAAFIQRGIIKTTWARWLNWQGHSQCPVKTQQGSSQDSNQSNNATDEGKPPLHPVRGMAPAFLEGLGQATKFCIRNLGTGLEKSKLCVGTSLLVHGSTHHLPGNKADAEKAWCQGAALVCSFHSTSSPLPQKNRELWVLLH